MDIKFEKDGVTKTTHEKFTKELEAVGWKVVEDKPKKKETKSKGSKK
tara:strand:+ start:3931 stop:4071 length:141 start_codon:yes stop_codon:yes gene_type:complete